MGEKVLLLPHQRVEFILKRMVHEIWERHYEAPSIALYGIAPQGSLLARRLGQLLTAYAGKAVHTGQIFLNKDTPALQQVQIDPVPQEGTEVILVDDVLFTGKTMQYAIGAMLPYGLRRIEVAVLVSRRSRTYPVAADYVGYELSTTYHDYVEVKAEAGGFQVYLLRAGSE